ncbi:hypothetical protein BGZ74_007170 [Mortierella antarctica]|nr:hypothetical protein BGZ74_007170 [Mortierella antarctica]
MAEKSEYPDFPQEKVDHIDISEDTEEEEFVHEEHQFTWRAVIVGSLLGCVVAASNIYLGLKIGWTFGAALWGSIFGFLILSFISKITRSIFGPKENAVCQAAATSAGGLSSGFVTAIPAMYRMGLMGDSTPEQDFVPLLLWTICSAFFGMFFAVPLRAHFVINQDLVFPTPRAAAETIKSLHRAGSSAAKDARDSGRAMMASFFSSMGFALTGYFIPGIFDGLHILYWIGKAAGSTAVMNADRVWGWFFAWDFSFFGAGLMTPGSTVFSFCLGELIAFGIAGPLMVDSGYLHKKGGFVYPVTTAGTAQSFFLWPGVAMMVVTAFAEVGAQAPALYHGVKGGVMEIRNLIRKLSKKSALVDQSGHVGKDTTPEHELIPTTWWMSGLFLSGLMTVLVMYFNFDVPVYATIGAIFLSFFLAFVGLQASGETDINPTGAVAKVCQLVFSSIPNDDIKIVQKTNLMCANISASVCSQSVDMVGDLKTAHLLKASPKAMFWAQMIGSVFAIFVAVPLFILYAKAYPCILMKSDKCQFDIPSVLAWEQVCRLLTGEGSLPKESLILTGVVMVLALLNVVIRVKFVPAAWKPYWLNMNAIGLGFIAPSPSIPIAMATGYIAGQIWIRVSKSTHEKLMYSVSAGFIAGIGIAGLMKAAMTIAGVEEGGITFGLPM